MNSCYIVDVGLVGYAEAWELQKRLVAARKAGAIADVLLLCEHPHVITLGRNGKREHLLASEQVLRQKGVEFHSSDRGGDITYHGPGQLVGYPILNLGAIRKDVVWYVRMLEELTVEDRLNDEVREILIAHQDEMRRTSVSYQEMYKKVKQQLARDRKLILR